jgi:MFS transporter, AAHS family, benzoate transport protein
MSFGIQRFVAGIGLGGILLHAQLSLQMNFLAFAIPSILAGVAIWFVQEKYSSIGQTRSYSKVS